MPSSETLLTGKKIIFIVTEDWFFCSHFLPMARAAQELGLDVTVICRVHDHQQIIEATGANVLPLQAERRSLNPFSALSSILKLSRMIKAEKPALVHCIAMRSILIGGAAALIAGVQRRVYALTGLGFLGARQDMTGRIARRVLRSLIRMLTRKETYFLFENTDDPKMLGLDPTDQNRVAIVGGAGVDPEQLLAHPLPVTPPLKLAVIARMLWSKGIDLVVEATEKARQRGIAVELSLYGAPDPSNPRAIPIDVLQHWNSLPGINWRGPTKDVTAIWRDHHVCCLPSRGGEGLPRTLLEGAACGRAIVTTDVPGCRDLVRHGVEGFVLQPDNSDALADAIATLASDSALLSRMGEAARQRILNGYTERDVMTGVQTLYRRCLQ